MDDLTEDLNRISIWCAELQARIEALESRIYELDHRTTGMIVMGPGQTHSNATAIKEQTDRLLEALKKDPPNA